MLLVFTALLSFAALFPVIDAQAAVWGQCGGIGWTGPTTCVAGSICSDVDEYYSQCIPGASSPVSSTHSSQPVSSTSVKSPVSSTASATGSGSTPTVSNPYSGYSVYLSPLYTEEVEAAVAEITDPTIQSVALEVANIPTFFWIDQVSKVSLLATYLADAESIAACTGEPQLVQIVIYDLPNRDCAAEVSDGDFTIANNGVSNYQSFINQIVAIIDEFPTVRVVAIVEPNSLVNLVTNLAIATCAAVEDVYDTLIIYAIQQLSSVGVFSYLDAGHAGELGWPANLSPAAQLFDQIYTSAGKPSGLRGLATNVANYNALVASSPDPITQGNPNYDEMLYINALAPLLQSQGFPAHFIVDQSRSGVQNIREDWGDWCNVKGAGFGIRPNSNNTGSTLIDAIVWAKPGGESDGTSNSSSPEFEPTCTLSDATVPAPEADAWFQAAFETLVTAANPPF